MARQADGKWSGRSGPSDGTAPAPQLVRRRPDICCAIDWMTVRVSWTLVMEVPLRPLVASLTKVTMGSTKGVMAAMTRTASVSMRERKSIHAQVLLISASVAYFPLVLLSI